jgi:two-component system response regulator GlrR
MQRQPHVLVIATPDHPSAPEESACLGSVFACLCADGLQQVSWDAYSRESLLQPGADLVVLVGLPDPFQALELLRWLRARTVSTIILAVLPRSVSSAEIDLAASNADDFVLWPERPEVLRQRILRLLAPAAEGEVTAAYENLIRELGRANLVGQDPVFLHIAERLSACAHTAFPVLITGETGTGKEMFARAIHFLSERRNYPFIPVDCAGLPDHLFENEFFGHARGAYTDAHGEQRGLAAMADLGTLFLDEVDALSQAAQAKLLRFLQERQFKPLGSERFIRTDARVVVASNRNLEQQTAEKLFRADLYYRLNVLHLDLPPLRDRPTDIALLAQHFLKTYLPSGVHKSFSLAALNRLTSYRWPGNVRELLNVVQRAIAFSRGAQINSCDIALAPPAQTGTADFRLARQSAIQIFERDYVQELLQRHAGNITHAAREAGKERRAFGRLVKKYGFTAQARAVGRS